MNAKDAKFSVCRHIKTNGRRCQSPALTGGALCYFHRNLHRSHRPPPTAESLLSTWQEETLQAFRLGGEDPLTIARAYPQQNELNFPPLEDAESVQLATSMLFQALSTGQIHFARARLLLCTLKIASINLRALAAADKSDSHSSAQPTRIVRTAHGRALAAPDDSPCETQPPTQPEPAIHAQTPLPAAASTALPAATFTALPAPASAALPATTSAALPATSSPTASATSSPTDSPAPETPEARRADRQTSALPATPAPKARHIPAWGGAPWNAASEHQRAEGPTHNLNPELAASRLTLIQ